MDTPTTPRWDYLSKPVYRYPKSIQDLLKLCEADPVELLIGLGFGVEEPDLCSKVPSRFIMNPSEAKGINIRVFLEAQRKRMEIENPNLCGRFRQLEVLEHVTNAFSSLLNDVHTNQSEHESKDGKKSILTKEKRKRIRQLLFKFSRQKRIEQDAKRCSNMMEPCKNEVEFNEASDDLRKTKIHAPEPENLETLSKNQMPAGNRIDSLFANQRDDNLQGVNHETSQCQPVKQQSLLTDLTSNSGKFKGPTLLSKAYGRTCGQQVRGKTANSFDIEEVTSIDEEYPKTLCNSDITRTNSCQSDSSGFQDEPPETLQTGHRHLYATSDSTVSQATIMENDYSKKSHEVSLDGYNEALHHENKITEKILRDDDTLQIKEKKCKLLSLSSLTSNEEFKSFESHTEDFGEDGGHGIYHEEKPKVVHEEIESDKDDKRVKRKNDIGDYECGLESHENSDTENSNVDFPVYFTHYLSKDIGSDDAYIVINEDQAEGSIDRSVSDLPNERNAKNNHFSKNDRSYLDSEISGTSFSLSDHLDSWSSSDIADDQIKRTYLSSKNKGNTFQTELSTNIYKSVTIQMSSTLMSDAQKTYPSEYLIRQHPFYSTRSDTNDEDFKLKHITNRKDAYCQTDFGWSPQTFNTHCMTQKCCFPIESHSFDTALNELYHPCSRALKPACSHCCHYCHCHHSSFSGISSYHNHSGLRRPNVHSSLEKDLSDTLTLLKKSLSNVTLNSDHEMEKMKKTCQRFRDQLLEMEQLLTEQQAGCFYTLSNEEREEIRRLYTLRRSVLKEVAELEFNLDERARNVKDTISLQLEQVLEEQSRLYSELELHNWEHERKLLHHHSSTETTTSFTTSASANYNNITEHAYALVDNPHEMDPKEPLQFQTQKKDFAAILQHIKKAFKSLNNS